MTNREKSGMTARELSLDMLLEILEKGGFCHIVERQALAKYQYLPKKERALATRLTEGVIERKITLDYVIDQVSRIKTGKMKPVIRNILRQGAYQILYMDRIPDPAACNEAVKLAEKRRFSGLKGFVNGVLREISRRKETLSFPDDAVRLSLPERLLSLWERELGRERALQVGEALLRERPTCVRCNRNLAGTKEITASLTAQGAEASPLPGFPDVLCLSGYDYLEALEAFQKGWIQAQDLSSALVGRAAAPKKGDFVLDVCAAPGGKSLHMADLLEGTGMVEARDLTWAKVNLIEEHIRRTGFSNIRARVWDALEPDETVREKADIVLADLPCSGLGIIGRKPDIKYRVDPEQLRSLAELQREILSVVWRYVKPGGRLVFSTCTVHRAENEENARWFLENFPFEAEDITGRLGEGIDGASMREGMVQLLPGIHPCDGFFLSVFRRKQE